MVRTLFLFGLLATSAASAQGVKLEFVTQSVDTFRFNHDGCNLSVPVKWTSTISTNYCSTTELRLWSSETECVDPPGTNDVRYTSVSLINLAAKTGNFTVPVSGLPGFKYSDAGTVCGTLGIEKSHKICGSIGVTNSTLACVQQLSNSLNLVYDTLKPVPPTIDAVAVQDSALLVKFTSTSTDTSVIRFYARAQGTTEFVDKGELASTAGTSIRISGLTNNTTYDIAATAEDAAENVSDLSEIFSATPRQTKGFFARYRDAGGADKGGCQSVAGIPLLFAGGLWFLRRKRK